MKRVIEWFVWIIQFIGGGGVGACLGLTLIFLRRGPNGLGPPVLAIARDQVSNFFWGAALIGAGFSSLFGDRLWKGSFYASIFSDGFWHSLVRRFISIVTIVSGSFLVLTALFER